LDRITIKSDKVYLNGLIRLFYDGKEQFSMLDSDFRKFYDLESNEAIEFTNAFFDQEQDKDYIMVFLEKLKRMLKNVCSDERGLNEINQLLGLDEFEKSMAKGPIDAHVMMEMIIGIFYYVYKMVIATIDHDLPETLGDISEIRPGMTILISRILVCIKICLLFLVF